MFKLVVVMYTLVGLLSEAAVLTADFSLSEKFGASAAVVGGSVFVGGACYLIYIDIKNDGQL